MKSTMDLADLVGLHILMTKIPGRCELKVLVAGLGMFNMDLKLTSCYNADVEKFCWLPGIIFRLQMLIL